VCGGGECRERLRAGGVAIAECAGCGVRFWRPPRGFDARSTYDASYFADPSEARGYDDYGTLEPALRRTFARRLARLGAPAPGARLLDVGAAYGFAVTEARAAGWSAFGVEVSAAAARRAGRGGGGAVVVADAATLPFPAAAFDAVTLWDVLEHLPDPHAAIAAASACLRPGGRLALTTGDVGSVVARVSGRRWHLYSIPEHLFFFTRRSLRLLLDAHGLRVESMRAEASLYPIGYLAERLRKTLLGRGTAGPPRWPGARLALPVNLFDVVTVSAVRRSPGAA
jgi:SAM-dependent methyltransferase